MRTHSPQFEAVHGRYPCFCHSLYFLTQCWPLCVPEALDPEAVQPLPGTSTPYRSRGDSSAGSGATELGLGAGGGGSQPGTGQGLSPRQAIWSRGKQFTRETKPACCSGFSFHCEKQFAFPLIACWRVFLPLWPQPRCPPGTGRGGRWDCQASFTSFLLLFSGLRSYASWLYTP